MLLWLVNPSGKMGEVQAWVQESVYGSYSFRSHRTKWCCYTNQWSIHMLLQCIRAAILRDSLKASKPGACLCEHKATVRTGEICKVCSSILCWVIFFTILEFYLFIYLFHLQRGHAKSSLMPILRPASSSFTGVVCHFSPDVNGRARDTIQILKRLGVHDFRLCMKSLKDWRITHLTTLADEGSQTARFVKPMHKTHNGNKVSIKKIDRKRKRVNSTSGLNQNHPKHSTTTTVKHLVSIVSTDASKIV